MASQNPSYIDYETFLSPEFSAPAFANTLVLSTNNASDSTLDLSTPLSRTLFDLQEIDTHIHNLTTQSALPLLNHTQSQHEATSRILASLSGQVSSLAQNYSRLESEVVNRHAAAEQVRLCAARLWVTLRIGRAVSRALALGRRLDSQMAEVKPSLTPGTGARRGDDHHAMLAATYTLLALRSLLAADGPGMEGEHLGRITVVNVLRRDLIEPSESRLKGKAQQTVREFSLTSLTGGHSTADSNGRADTRSPGPDVGSQTTAHTYAQAAETRNRTTSALIVLYLMSPVSKSESRDFIPTLLLTALQTYLQTALTSSSASLSRALAQLPQLPRALNEVTARCKNVVSLEALLRGIEVPEHPALSRKTDINGEEFDHVDESGHGLRQDEGSDLKSETLLLPLLNALDTSSLASFFWRSLASNMGGKVLEIINRGGAPARSLRSQKERVRDMVRDAVFRGCDGVKQPDGRSGNSAWEREATVMVASITTSNALYARNITAVMASVPRLVVSVGGNTSMRLLSGQHLCCKCQIRLHRSSSKLYSFKSHSSVRTYATNDSSSSSSSQSFLEPSKQTPADPNLSWPTTNSANPYEIPSPYEIFQIHRDAPYNKRRFYELVKLYHPDRLQVSVPSDPSSKSLSQTAKLERYRMVIAANELLSDPRRRQAYDKYGIGWDGNPKFGPSKPRWADANDRRWSGFDDNVHNSPRRNATWEDWERWHMRAERTHGEQRETFTSNGTFVAILVIAAGFATVVESMRMDGHNRSMLHQVEQRHDTSSRELVRRRVESHEFIARDDRMRRFLMLRGPVGTEVEIRAVGQEKEGTEFVPDYDNKK